MNGPDGRVLGRGDHAPPAADPAARVELFDMLNGYWRTQMVCTAAELGLADELADGPCDIATLARRTGAGEQELVRLLRVLVAFGVFARTGDGRYATTSTGRWLERDQPGGMHARSLLVGRLWYPAWSRLLHSIRTGQTALEHHFGRPLFEHLAADSDTAEIFDATMAESTRVAVAEVVEAYDTRWASTVVDLGGGTGALLTGLLENNPRARGVLVETPDVATRARSLIAAGPVRERCEVRDGDFFTEVPAGADLYLLSWIVHDWRDAPAVRILSNCRRAMSDTARLLVIEAVLPEQPEPTDGVLYDLHMMAVAGGLERTEAEYDRLLTAAGLERTATLATRGLRSILEVRPARALDEQAAGRGG
jgi:hypothetical protein